MNKIQFKKEVKCTWKEPEFNDKLQASVSGLWNVWFY